MLPLLGEAAPDQGGPTHSSAELCRHAGGSAQFFQKTTNRNHFVKLCLKDSKTQLKYQYINK